jgi:hypothetical protein
MHDTLPVTIAQLGVCLVSYQGDQGSWLHRLFRRDLRQRDGDVVAQTLELLERRQQRAAFDHSNRRDQLSDLARRGIMTYAERAVLVHRSTAAWRMGHGNPTPHELLTGAGMIDLLERSLELLNALVQYEKFVFVSSSPKARMLLTIGQALRPLEYAICDTQEDFLNRLHHEGRFEGDWARALRRVREFAGDVGPKVLVGVYRATEMAPAQVFYAHRDHVHLAALIAIADSVLQEQRGFPMLITLADNLCSETFGAASFHASVQMAYQKAGHPFRYLNERQTRR